MSLSDTTAISIRVDTAGINIGEELTAFTDNLPNTSGAVATFIGRVRVDDHITRLHLEHYPGMTEKALSEIATTAIQRWSLPAVRIIHRVGKLAINDVIVFVATAANHRQNAFLSCQYITDFLKSSAPFWKQEIMADGKKRWVEERQTDQLAIKKWQS